MSKKFFTSKLFYLVHIHIWYNKMEITFQIILRDFMAFKIIIALLFTLNPIFMLWIKRSILRYHWDRFVLRFLECMNSSFLFLPHRSELSFISAFEPWTLGAAGLQQTLSTVVFGQPIAWGSFTSDTTLGAFTLSNNCRSTQLF